MGVKFLVKKHYVTLEWPLTCKCLVLDLELDSFPIPRPRLQSCQVELVIAMICITKSRTGNHDFRACARARGFIGSTRFGRTHTLRRVCRAIMR